MSAWLIGLVAVLYVAIAVSLWFEGRSGLGASYLAYAVANAAILFDVITKGH